MKYSFTLCLLMFLSASTVMGQKVTFYASHPYAKFSDSSPGHIWVGLSHGSETIKTGFYRSELRDERNRKADLSYSYDVTPAQYRAAKQVISRFDDSNYKLGSRDCRAFAEAIAEAIDLKPPAWSMASPGEWLGQLVEGN